MNTTPEKNTATLARAIKLIVMDVDGVLTDGKITYSSTGDELKSFTTQDGQAIKIAQRAGIDTAIITGRQSAVVERRAKELGINHLFQGKDGKIALLQQLVSSLGLESHEVAYIGDDLPDLAPIQWVGLGIAPANARPIIAEHADLNTQKSGGEGVMVEVVDFILQSQQKYDAIMQSFMLSQPIDADNT